MKDTWKQQLDHLFAPWDSPLSPGCALGVYKEGEIIYKRGYGLAHLEHGVRITPSTVFHVASLSKQFAAMAAGLLIGSGRISFNDRIQQFIPELQSGLTITLRHIIHHTSGLRDQWDLLRLGGWRYTDLKTNSDILALVARQKELNFLPGTRFQYINSGYTLMGIAIERITGKSLREFADENIFKPLGMTNTWFHDDYQSIVNNRAQAYSRGKSSRLRIDVPPYETVGPTGLFSTVEDFALWERNFLFPKVGDEELIAQMLAPGSLDDGRQTDYGFGLIIGNYRGLRTVEHSGGDAGYRTHFLRFPAERFAVAIFCNYSEIKPRQLAREVADICLAGRFQSLDTRNPAEPGRTVEHIAPAADELESKSGLYRDTLNGIICRMENRAGRLFFVSGAGGDYELIYMDDERFRFLDVDAECHFKPAEGDNPDQVFVKQRGQTVGVLERVADKGTELDYQAEEYAGTYYSDELDTQYRIEPSSEGLVLQRPKFSPSRLRPFSKDEFSDSAEMLHLRFIRDEAGLIRTLILSAERAWNVRFARL